MSKCPVCQHKEVTPYLTVKDHFLTGESFQLIHCENCDLKFTYPAPADVGKYYDSEEYYSHHTSSTSLISVVYQTVRNIQLRNKYSLISKLTSGKRILDYGCGTGEFLAYMQQHQYHVHGLEVDKDARIRANEKINNKVVANISALSNEFDIITLWHVLEHVQDPVSLLRQLYKLLDAQGYLILALPNHESPDATYYKENWAGYDVPRHLFHFSPKSLSFLSTLTGFTIDSVLPMKYDAFYVSLLSEKYKKSGLLRYPKSLVSGIKSNMRARKNGNYSSLVYILKKA